MRLFLFLLLAAGWTMPASAGLIFTLERTGAGVDFPHLTLRNESSAPIESISLALGDASMNFDYARLIDSSPGLVPELITPDTLNAADRSDVLEWRFLFFEPSQSFSAELDLDRDLGSATVDWQQALFNNGDMPNALLHIQWSGGPVSVVALPDDIGRDPLTPYVLDIPMVEVPEPASIVLFLLGTIVAACRAVRRFF